MKKKLAVILLCVAMAVSVLAGCGGETPEGGENSKSSDVVSKTGEEGENSKGSDDSEVVNKTGYPIVKEPVTLKVGVLAPEANYEVDYEKLEWIQNIQKVSGVQLEFEYYADAEAVKLMFTSRDYPDITLNIGDQNYTAQVEDAAAAGDLYALDEMMEEWAPNWASYFAKNAYHRRLVTLSDGHIYAFPCVVDNQTAVGLRDQWFIRQEWLDQLGLKMPTTVDEFFTVLKAFKDNAGKGTIPENVVPWSVWNICTNQNGGALELFGSYGVLLCNAANAYMVSVDNNGKVEFNWNSEAVKEPLKFIHKCVEEGIIPMDSLTKDYADWSASTVSENSIAGCFSTYYNPEASGQSKIVPMGLLDAGNGETPVLRVQTNAVRPNKMLIFKNCKYPEVAMRLADMIAEEEYSIQGYYGTFGDTYLKKNDDGTYKLLDYPANSSSKVSPGVRSPILCSTDVFEKVELTEGTDEYYRKQAREQLYSQYTVNVERMFPPLIPSAKNKDQLNQLYMDIKTYVEKTWNTWAIEGGIEEGWDEYTAQLESYGLEKYLQLLQEELDAFNAG